MLWSELTSEQMVKAVEPAEGVCLLPFGIIERHGPHLPLGQDQMMVSEVARRAAAQEPAVVCPDFYFGQIHEARHAPGTICTPYSLSFALLENVLEEIVRNGFNKILIVNGHGGNTALVSFFLECLLDRRRPYAVYCCNFWMLEGETAKKWEEMRETIEDGHAGESETSAALEVFPQLVDMDAVPDPADGRARGRLTHLGSLGNSLSWYANYPTHYCGNAKEATVRKGAFLVRAWVENVVRAIRAVKSDTVTEELLEEFHGRAEDPLRS